MRRITTPKEWDRHLAAQPVSGKTVKLYCDANNLDLSSFYRQRKRREYDASADTQTFVLAPALEPRKVFGCSVCIRVGDFALTLDPGYGPDDLEGVLVALAKVQHVLCGE